MTNGKQVPVIFRGWFFAVCSCLVLLSAVDVTVCRAGGNKIGIVDTARLVLESQYGQKMKAEFTAELETQRKTLDKKRDEVGKQQQKVTDMKASNKDPEAIEKQEKELNKMVREFKWMKDDLDKELVETDTAFQAKMKERVRKVLEAFIATTDYCIIIEKQRVAVFCDSADVTDQIIRRLDDYKE